MGLYCELARTPLSQHKEDIVPEAWRNGKSKRQQCTFRVNVSHSPEMGIIYISKAYLIHNHPIRQASEENALGLKGLTNDEISFVGNLAANGATRTSTLRVFSYLSLTLTLRSLTLLTRRTTTTRDKSPILSIKLEPTTGERLTQKEVRSML